MIKKFTITGADDSIKPEELISITKAYPFVEWGILLSRSSQGGNRFPSENWIRDLMEIKDELSLSGHLCGAYVREFAQGQDRFIYEDLQEFWAMFQRFQINFHGQEHITNASRVADIISTFPNKEFIFQYDNVNTAVVQQAIGRGLTNISALFDLSHGAGVLPKAWPLPLGNIKCGYAGGLSPENLEGQIQKIEELVGEIEIWIDIETHVRSDNDLLFDLKKVNKCLEIASKYIK